MSKKLYSLLFLLLIISINSEITYINYYISSTSDDKEKDLSINVYLNETEQAVYLTSEDFDSIKINGNVNYFYESYKIEYIYSCNQIVIYSPSFFLYWKSQQTPFEFELECTLQNKTINFNKKDLIEFEDRIYIYIPGIVGNNFEDSTNGDLLYSLVNQNISKNFTFTLNKEFDFNNYFFGLDPFNQGTEFYIGNGFAEFNSKHYIILNRFISINSKVANTFYNSIREPYNITNNEIYTTSLISTIKYRNFYFDNLSLIQLENILINPDVLLEKCHFIHINIILFSFILILQYL